MRSFQHPARTVASGFFFTIVVGSLLLMLPAASTSNAPTDWLTAFFTAVSAVCVTGLVIVDTGTYWSLFGQSVLLVLFQVGGFGMMTAATLLGLMVNRSLRLRTRLVTQIETHALALGDVSSVARLVLIVTLVVEMLVSILLIGRLRFNYDLPWSTAAWSGIFHAVSAFNNAGFSLHEDSLVRYVSDWWILVPVAAAIVLGGIGFPVLQDLRIRLWNPRHWSLHTKLTLTGTLVLLVGGTFLMLWFEWSNQSTLGPLDMPSKVLAAAFSSASARTAGFNAVDIASLTQESLAMHYLLMFIGGGSAGTAGGVKVGTFLILTLLVWSEIRGRRDLEAFGRRISSQAQRQAITVLMLASTCVVVATIVLLRSTDFPMDQVIFEVLSAFGTVGLSTGITSELPPIGLLTLAGLMYIGRVGTITLAVSLALGERRAAYRFPEEHPIVG